MKYHIKKLNSGRFEVLDLHANRKLEGTDAHPRAALAKALFHAYSTYGTIEAGNIIAPKQVVHISYKHSFINVKEVKYTYGCRYYLDKLKVGDKEPELEPVQLNLFERGVI